MTRPRQLAILAAAALAAVLVAAPATAAATTSISLNPGQRDSTAGDFPNSCDNIPAGDISPGTDGWVFVLPDEKASFVSLKLTFDAGTVNIPGSSYPNGFATQGADKAWVVLPAGWTLLDGRAEITGGSKDNEFFNVTHVCQTAGPTRAPSASPTRSPASPHASRSTVTSPTAGSVASRSPGSPAGGSGSGSLPVTGAPAATLAGVGLILTGAGIALLLVRRRRAEDSAGPAE